MRTTLYANEALTIIFSNGKTYSIFTNETANLACVIKNGNVVWGETFSKIYDLFADSPIVKMPKENGKIFAFAFGANVNTMYGHTLEDSIWLSVYDHKHRGHDLER